MAEDLVEIKMTDRSTQEIQVIAEGDFFRSVTPGATSLDSVDEDHSLDMVALFAAAANIGLLGDEMLEPWLNKASVVGSSLEEPLRRISWQLRIESMPLSALRVLANMARSRPFSSIRITSVEQKGTIINTDRLLAIPYPVPFQPNPFPVDYVAPLKKSKDRVVRIEFSTPPSDATVQNAYRAMELWTCLIMLGAYPRADQHPSQAGAMPDLAILLDEVTIEQAFPEAFMCDEAAFNAVVNWAQCSHRSNPVAQVQIR